MSLISRAIPGLFGGVSQAIPAMRHPTQCEVQENALSTTVDGLFKRPGTRHIRSILKWPSGDPVSANDHIHVIDQGDGKRWALIFGPGGIAAVNMETGASESVSYQDVAGSPSAMSSYLTASDPQTAFRTITVADTTFIVNREKTVTSQNLDSYANPLWIVAANVRVAAAQHTYTISVNGTQVSHTAPATGATTATIASALASAITAAGAGFIASANTFYQGEVNISRSLGLPITDFSVSDTFGNTAIVGLWKAVPKFSDLPPVGGANGMRYQVTGSDSESYVDPYWVTCDFTNRVWKETREPGIQTTLNADSMPFKMFRSGGAWYVRPIAWADRLVGDDKTNPMPSFVGRQINDIFFYRNRLGFLAGDALSLSRSGDYYNFFAETARDVLDTDPIDLSGSGESVEKLDYVTPFNQELIVWATRNQQFALAGGDTLTPNTARLVPTTAFEASNTARPKQVGNRIVFPSTINGYTQLQLFKVSADTVSNTAESITEHVPSFIPKNPRSLELSQTAKMLAVVPQGVANTLYVFKYEEDKDQLTQKAWQKFILPGGVVKAHFSGQRLYLFVKYDNATATGETVVNLEYMDFSKDTDFWLKLDRLSTVEGTSATPTGTPGQYSFTFTTTDSPGLKVYHYSGTSDGIECPVVSKTVNPGTPSSITFVVQTPTTAGSFSVGVPYLFRYTFTEVFMRDAQGVPVMDAKLKLLKVLLRYVDTGPFKVKVTNAAGGTYEYPFSGFSVGGLDSLLGGAPQALATGDFSIPVQAQAQGTVITIESDSTLQCRFPYAEWRGSSILKSQR